MANWGQAPALLPARLGPAALLPNPIGLLAGPIPLSIFRRGSKLRQIDDFLRTHPYHFRHGPTYVALILSAALRVRVFDGEVGKVLRSWAYTRKRISIVPGHSRPQDRIQHRLALQAMWTNDNMVRAPYPMPPLMHIDRYSLCLWMRKHS